jgi:hypothetical protein
LKALVYSPKGPQEYSRPTVDGWRAGIGAELAGEEHRALWNLYWLSDEALDCFLTDWDAGALPDLEMLAACGKALDQQAGGEMIRGLVLTLTPAEFVAHILKHDCKHLAPYRYAGWSWLKLLQARAELYRGVAKVEGSVVYANFGGRSQNQGVTTSGRSATIMPLALKKS